MIETPSQSIRSLQAESESIPVLDPGLHSGAPERDQAGDRDRSANVPAFRPGMNRSWERVFDRAWRLLLLASFCTVTAALS